MPAMREGKETGGMSLDPQEPMEGGQRSSQRDDPTTSVVPGVAPFAYPRDREIDDIEAQLLDLGVCPDCGTKRFWEGPHGGMNVNIQCSGCGSKFNVIPRISGMFGKERLTRGNGRPVPGGFEF
jgi:hypothetical protein